MKVKAKEGLFFILLALYLFYRFINITMFYQYIPAGTSVFFLLAFFALLMYQLSVYPILDRTETILACIILPTLLITGVFVGYREIITMTCLIFCVNGIEGKKIVRCYFLISLFVCLLAVLSASAGIVENVVWKIGWKNYFRVTQRQGMGFIYPTDFVSCVFFTLSALFFLLKDEPFHFGFLVALFGIAILTYYTSVTRLDSGSILLLAAGYIVYGMMRKRPVAKWEKWIAMSVTPLCAMISIAATFAYNEASPKWGAIDYFFSGRLYYGNLGIQNYGICLFGKEIVMKGLSVVSQSMDADYFFLDCSYVNILLRYGVISLIWVCVLTSVCAFRAYEQGNRSMMILIVLVAVNSVVGQHLFDGYSNFILFLAFSKLTEVSVPRRSARWQCKWRNDVGSTGKVRISKYPELITPSKSQAQGE